jgi:glutamate 5-kinase
LERWFLFLLDNIKACAAVEQNGLMALYDTLFSQESEKE